MFKQKGVSLIELMISLLIGLILMSGVVQMFISSKGTYTTQKAMSRVQETGRLAIDFIAKDIRLAGYNGCMSRGDLEIVNGLSSDANGKYEYDFDEAIRGYTAATADTAIDIDANTATDVLVVRSAGASSLVLTQASGSSTTLLVSGEETNDCLGDVCKDDVVVISDCVQARRFQITDMAAVSGGSTTNIARAEAGTPGNQSPSSWGQEFDPGAEIIRVSTMVYYIANNDFGNPTLYQKTGANTAIELLEGIEDMRLTFSESGSNYVEAASVGNWDNVTSVNVEVLVRSVNDNVIQDEQPYTFAGVTTTPSDRRLRQSFNTSVALRNRLQ